MATDTMLWHRRATTEWALTLVAGTRRHLITRVCDENGLDFEGRPVPWRTIATFESYNDAEMVLRRLKAAEPPSLAGLGYDSHDRILKKGLVRGSGDNPTKPPPPKTAGVILVGQRVAND